MDIYDKVNPKMYETNPARKEIKLLLKNLDITTQKAENLAKEYWINGRQLEEFRNRSLKLVDEIETSLINFANIAPQKSFLAGEDLADYFIKGQHKVLDDDGNVVKLYNIRPRDTANPKYMEIINETRAKTLKEVKAISNSLRDNLDNAVRKSMYELRHPTGGKNALSKSIENILLNEGIKITDSRGRLWSPTSYSKMYARTRTREYQTTGTEYRMKEVGMDLVMISMHVDVDGMDICNEYEGNVYSLSGDSEKYPKLIEHTPFHPNCAHVETPWSEKYHEVEPRNRLGLDGPEADEIIENIEDIKTPYQMDKYFKNKYNVNVNLDERFNYTPEQLQGFTRVQVKMLDKYPDIADNINNIEDFYTKDLRKWKANFRFEEQELFDKYFDGMSVEEFAKARGIDVKRLAKREQQLYEELKERVGTKPNINEYRIFGGSKTMEPAGRYDQFDADLLFHPQVIKNEISPGDFETMWGSTSDEVREHLIYHEFGHAVDDFHKIVNKDTNEEFFDLWKVVHDNYNSEYREEIMSAKKLTTYYGSTDPKEMFAENFAFMERGGIVADKEINNYVEYLMEKAKVKIIKDTTEEVVENYDDLYRAWKAGLRDREERVINNWTGGGYRDIRKYQQGLLDDEYLASTVKTMEEALEKAPKYRGPVYRGLSNLPEDVREEIWNSKKVKFNTFTSTSKSESVAINRFSDERGIIFEFQNTNTGVDVNSLSQYSSEREILFAKGAEFEVIDRTIYEGMRKLILRQVK